MSSSPYAYIAVMAAVTYAIRVLPLTLIRREIKNRYVRAFLRYVPYATLSAMTFPAMLSATRDIRSGIAAAAAALAAAAMGKGLFIVSSAAVAAVFFIERYI